VQKKILGGAGRKLLDMLGTLEVDGKNNGGLRID